MEQYIPRTLESALHQAVKEFPAVVLTGPRQSGKTTLLKQLFADQYGYISLEPPDVRDAARTDPRGFLAASPVPVIFDEIQYAPELLPYIKELIDQDRDAKGRYILTGSQNLMLTAAITESLAGRAALLCLLPLSFRELCREPDRRFPWEKETADPVDRGTSGLAHADLWRQLIRGNYPELAREPDRNSDPWHSSYMQTYLERDIRTLRQVGDLTLYRSFLIMLAARSGQLLNLNDLSRDLGVALNTIKSWLSILEATYQVIILRPWFSNTGKRLVKTPKVYFTDTGTLCHLTGLKEVEHAWKGPMAGALFETAVVVEIHKSLLHRARDTRLSFWRTSDGREVDLVVDDAMKLIPMEIKSTATPRPAMAKYLRTFVKDCGRPAHAGFVVHSGESRLPLGDGVMAVPFGDI